MDNVKLSLEKYIHDTISATEGLTIDYEGLPFDETSVDTWIQPRLIAPIGTFYRQGSSTEYAEDIELMYQVNIFVKKSGVTTTYKHYDIRDRVVYYFRIGQDIDIKAYAEGGSTQLMKVRVRELITDLPIREDPQIYQYSLAWILQQTRLTTEP